jgi:predicted MFS family arabinose efflux permease
VLIVLYMTKGLGFQPGVLGMIWALGGISSLVAAVFATSITRRLGAGPVMVLGLLFSGIGMMLIPLAKGATLASMLLLIASQLVGDGAMMVYRINKMSLQQSIAPPEMVGRVNASMQFIGIGATLAGSILGGALGETVGVRTTLFIGAFGILCSMLMLALSPIRKLRDAEAV